MGSIEVVKEKKYRIGKEVIIEERRVQFKTKIFYNRIPCIMHRLGHKMLKIEFGDSNAFLRQVVEEFREISWKFDQLGSGKYFPNIRFVVFKMLKRHGASINFFAPIIRTRRKYKPLDDLFNKLVD